MFFDAHTHLDRNPRYSILNNKEISQLERPFSVGIHPRDVLSVKVDLVQFGTSLKSPNCLALGEAGLDKILRIPIQKQLDIFELQVYLSEKFKIPLILHCVKAWNEVQKVRMKMKPRQKWIFHGFRKVALLDAVLADENMLIGLGTAILWDEKLQNALSKISLDRMLLETDDDEGNSIEEVYECVARLKNISLQALQNQLEINFKNTFQKWEIGSKDLNF